MEKPESETGKSDSGSQRKTGTGQYARYDESIRAEPDSGTRYASPYDYSERICKEYEAIETYLDQLLESYVEVQEERWTRIRNLDILLSEKKKEANLENIRFQIEADVLQSLPFKETETSVLFGNLLDNAIEACKKMKTETRWIRVEIRQRKGFLFFTIANSIGKRPQEKDGEFVSDKEDKKVHGYGLKSIRRIVKKYDGSFQCDVVEEEVKISISFSNK